jgi:hypothetical protein
MTLDNGGGAASSTIPQLVTIDIFNYYSGSNFVTVLATLSQDKNGSGEVTRTVGLLRDTFVTSIDLSPTSSWAAGTTATLYGIKAA